MGDREDQMAADTSRRIWRLTLGVAGWAILGAFLLIVVSLPELADESNASPPVEYYIAVVVLFAGVASRIYVVVRRTAVSRLGAVVVAVLAIPGIFLVASFTFVSIANVAS